MRIDHKLIKSCVEQDRGAQKKLYVHLLPYLRAIAHRYLKDNSYVKDVLQESFVKIFKGLNKFDSGKASLKQWASRITINTCINYNKRVIGLLKEEFVIEKHQSATMPAILQNWSNEELLQVLKKMPEEFFEVFNLYVIDGYSHEETAAMLGISQELSRKRLSRAKRWLKFFFRERSDLAAHFNLPSFFQN